MDGVVTIPVPLFERLKECPRHVWRIGFTTKFSLFSLAPFLTTNSNSKSKSYYTALTIMISVISCLTTIACSSLEDRSQQAKGLLPPAHCLPSPKWRAKLAFKTSPSLRGLLYDSPGLSSEVAWDHVIALNSSSSKINKHQTCN